MESCFQDGVLLSRWSLFCLLLPSLSGPETPSFSAHHPSHLLRCWLHSTQPSVQLFTPWASGGASLPKGVCRPDGAFVAVHVFGICGGSWGFDSHSFRIGPCTVHFPFKLKEKTPEVNSFQWVTSLKQRPWIQVPCLLLSPTWDWLQNFCGLTKTLCLDLILKLARGRWLPFQLCYRESKIELEKNCSFLKTTYEVFQRGRDVTQPQS